MSFGTMSFVVNTFLTWMGQLKVLCLKVKWLMFLSRFPTLGEYGIYFSNGF